MGGGDGVGMPEGVVPEEEAVPGEGKGVPGVRRVGRRERGRGLGWTGMRGGRGETPVSLRLFRLF